MSEQQSKATSAKEIQQRIAELETELKQLKSIPVVVELTDEEKKTGIHASNAGPAPIRKLSEKEEKALAESKANQKSHDYYNPA